MDSGWLGVSGLFERAGALFTVVSTGTGAISGKGMRDNIGMRKGKVVLVVIVGVQGSFGLGYGEAVGLTTSRLFLCLFICFFIGIYGFGVLWGSPTCNRLSRTLNRGKRLLWSACSAECSCSTCASRASRSLTLTRRAACGLWEILIYSSKDSTRSGEVCKLEADEWVFWELLFILMIHFKSHFNKLDTGLAENLDIQILGRIILYGSN